MINIIRHAAMIATLVGAVGVFLSDVVDAVVVVVVVLVVVVVVVAVVCSVGVFV